MGNRVNKNPIVIDTTDVAIPGPLSIQAIAWIGGGESTKDIVVGDRLRIKFKDENGDVCLDVKVTIDTDGGPLQIGYQQSFPRNWEVSEGLYIEDIVGGELYIWV